jgi:hypothetical protein
MSVMRVSLMSWWWIWSAIEMFTMAITGSIHPSNNWNEPFLHSTLSKYSQVVGNRCTLSLYLRLRPSSFLQWRHYWTHSATFFGHPKFVRTKHEVRYHSAHLYLVGFKFDHQNVHNVITTCIFSSITHLCQDLRHTPNIAMGYQFA